MKHYAIFYRLDDNGAYVEACGDRHIILLDGRHNRANQHAAAQDWGKRHGYAAYTIERGENLLRLFCLTSPRAIAA